MIYTVTEPKRLDTIVYEHYNTLDVFEFVLEANKQHLDKYILDAGDQVILPEVQIVKEKSGDALWD
jgi:phage tail protein X